MSQYSGVFVMALLSIISNTEALPAGWNKYWNSEAFLVVRNVPLERCVHECQARDRCKAVNYWRVRRNCELMDNNTAALLAPTNGHPCLAISKTDMSQTTACVDCRDVCVAESGVCLVKECFAPPVVDNGRLRGNMMNVGAWMKLVCDEWYKPEAEVDRVKCQDGGRWGPVVLCVPAVDCGTPPTVANAIAGAMTGDAIPGTVVVYSCSPGYAAPPTMGNFTSTCQPSGNWTSRGFECLRDCGDPQPVPNAFLSSGSNNLENAVSTYTCDVRHYVKHNGIVTMETTADATCQSNGTWNVDFECILFCDVPSVEMNAQQGSLSGHVAPGTEVIYSCKPGFGAPENANDFRRICEANGTWSTIRFECMKDCSSPPSEANAVLDVGGTLLGAIRNYTCWNGYVTQTSASGFSTICQAKGWLVPTEACLRECSDPPTVSNADISTGNRYQGSIRTYTCHVGYYVKTGGIVTTFTTADVSCQISGTWNINFDCVPGCGSNSPLVADVPVSKLTASSEYKDYLASEAKLNSNKYWSANGDSTDEYVQVDFNALKVVTEVIVQGAAIDNEYVQTYKLLTSTDCASFQPVQQPSGGDKIFTGVDKKDGEVSQPLDTPVTARCVRINPQTFITWPSLRFELLGCDP